jgi:hypothetical protein
MTLNSKEHYDLMAMFEHEFRGDFRLDKEDKTLWKKGHLYQDGNANLAFLAYRRGYAFARTQ